MSKRVVFVASVAVVLAAMVGPASAQTYPPPSNSITVDDPTPVPGQTITVSMQVCRPGTRALFGLDLRYAADGVADARGVARADVLIPPTTDPGRHLITGTCLRPDLLPLTTWITVQSGTQDDGVSSAGGTAGGTGGGADPDTDPSVVAAQIDAADPSPADIGAFGGGSPAELRAQFDESIADAGRNLAVDDSGAQAPAGDGSRATGSSDAASPGTGALALVGRVLLGLVAVGSVPAALVLSRRSGRGAAEGFAWP